MKQSLALSVATLSALLVPACGGGGGSGSGGAASQMDLVEVSNGRGLMLPHQVFRLDSQGNSTSQLVAIRNQADLINNVTLSNRIQPVTEWPVDATLPDGAPGNHFIYATFTQDIAVSSVLDPSPAGQGGLIGPITVLAVDPSTNSSVPVKGRAFIGGKTYAGLDPNNPPNLELQTWVTLDANGNPVAADVGGNFPGLGFPGTQDAVPFGGAGKLVNDRTFVFIADTDGDLTTHERFPANRQIRLRATTALRAKNGENLKRQVVASATVGPDNLPPEVLTTPPPGSVPVTTPTAGDVDVDPQTKIRVEFTEPIQPASLTTLPTGAPAGLSSALEFRFGPSTQQTKVPFTGLPLSVYDLTIWEFTPGFAFPGNGPATQACGTFSEVTISVLPSQLQDLVAAPNANTNNNPASATFRTGEGPGLVNAPVTPDAIYVGRQGATPGISIIDLNGFGQGTGDPSNTNFLNNPNLLQYGANMFPPLFPGTCTVDAGSSGPFSLTKDSSLNDLLLRPPLITTVGEMMIGQSLDLVFHNAKDATGCRNGGGSFCAVNGKKLVQTAFQTGSTLGPPSGNQIAGVFVPGGANPVSYSPHPNPPPLIFPPLCLQPFIGGQEPTSEYTRRPIFSGGLGLANLLAPGTPVYKPAANPQAPPIPPTGIPARFNNGYFVGPDRASLTSSGVCFDYQYRQQIGQFLYMLDRGRREVVVLNSNRMSVLDRISVPDPTDMAMGPQLDFLAVSNQNADSVSFINIDPNSSNFHKVVKTTPVGRGPRGIAWDPGNEDILVCNESEGTLSIISVFDFNVRNTAISNINTPFDVAITQRQTAWGFFRRVYFGWVLNRNGAVTLFESGPNGVNGWGYDDTIGTLPFTFQNPKKIAASFNNLGGSAWILHENPLSLATGDPTGQTGGAATRVDIESGFIGVLPLNNLNFFVNPQIRDLDFRVSVSIGPDQLTGIPVDMALDDLNNLAATSNAFDAVFGQGFPLLLNGKSLVKPQGAVFVFAKSPEYLFLAIPNSSEGPGVIDVINTDAGFIRFDVDGLTPGTQSIDAPGARYLCDYWRQ